LCPIVLGELLIAEGRNTEGIEQLLDAGSWLEDRGLSNPAVNPWRALITPALAHAGRLEQARSVSEAAVERARVFGSPWGLGMALRAAGTVADGTGLLEEAIEVLSAGGCRLELARARLALGAKLRRENQRARAREHLREALELAHRCGASPIAAAASEELAATGARPRRVMFTGVESLTASERRAARLAADGLSNPEIAQRLFVTRKTVEAHLGHAYMKLGINAREQLAAALADDAQDLLHPLR
jgi:DNA-binding CsgD family transcriptional regulator